MNSKLLGYGGVFPHLYLERKFSSFRFSIEMSDASSLTVIELSKRVTYSKASARDVLSIIAH
jgi:hypothetical protein